MAKASSGGVVYDFQPSNLPDDILQAIGLVTTSAAQTEAVVEMAIAGCLGIDMEYGMAVTTHMSAPLRDSVLRSAAEIRIDDLDALDELDVLLDGVDAAYQKRNAIVHRAWARHPTTNAVYTVRTTARTRVDMELIPMSVAEVIADGAFIYDAGMALMTFLIAHGLLPDHPSGATRGHKSKAARKKRRKGLGGG